MKICIDAGHNFSSYDTGATGNGLREQDVTFGIASKLKQMLEEAGVEVIMTRTYLSQNLGLNSDDSLAKRCRIANENECDLFISIHCNSHINVSANGTEVLVWDPMYKEGSDRFDTPGRKGKVRLDGTDAYADFSEIEQDCYQRPYFLFWKE